MKAQSRVTQFAGGLDPTVVRTVEKAPDAVLVLDGRASVLFANGHAERLLGRSRGSLRGELAELATESAELELRLSALAPGESVRGLSLALRLPGGGTLPLSVSACALECEAGAEPLFLLFLRELGDLQRELLALRTRNEELEHCMQTLSHDLRSPLVALLGFSRLLRQDYGAALDETANHFLDRIEQAGRTMEDLIHDLLELSRIEQATPRPDLVDPRAVLLQLQAELKPRLEASGVRLELPDHPPLVLCDRTRLYQVFSNLIGNALEYMGASGDPRIVVDVRDEGDRHDLTVRDFGQGIAPEHHARIFQVFESLGPRRDGRSGTGIGLAIVRKVAEVHGGRAWVESQLGTGATFHVTLPKR